MTHESPTWVVYDMDGVITTKNCFYSYLRVRLTSSPRRVAKALPALVRMARAHEHDDKVQQGYAITAAALAGLSLKEYHAAAKTFGAQLADKPGHVREDVATRIREHHAEGARIVIATACERVMAESVLAAANVPYDVLSATEFSEEHGRIIVSDPRVDARKAEALRELGIPLAEADFYTDDFSDYATARLCARTYLVGASNDTIAAFRATRLEVHVEHDQQ